MKLTEHHDRIIEILLEKKKGRCWAGYEPTPGVTPYDKGSCRPKGSKKKLSESNQIILEFDPNRGAKGRAKPRYGHYPTDDEKKKIKQDFGGELPNPKRMSKPANMRYSLNNAFRQTYNPDYRSSSDALGHFFAAKRTERFQPISSPRIPGQFDNAKNAGSKIQYRRQFPKLNPSDSPAQRLIKKFKRRKQGQGTPAYNLEKNVERQKKKARKERNLHNISPEDFSISEAIINIIAHKLLEAKTPAWQRSEGQNKEGGLNAKGRASAKAQGHNLKPPVSAEQAKKSEESAGRRKSFCARMSGMKKKLTSKKTAGDPDSRINKSLRKWDC